MPVEVLQIVKDALFGFNVYMPGESVKDADAEYCVGQINMILDDWNAQREAVWAEVFQTFVTVPGLQPHTLGPTGVWVMPERPVTIDGVSWLNGGIYSNVGISTDSAAWFARPGITSAVLSRLYYSPEEPNGLLYFDGVPSGATTVRLMTRVALTSVILTDSVSLPQGYRSALTLTLMEAIAEAFGKEVSGSLAMRAGKARSRAFANNLQVPSLQADTPFSGRGWWNYRTGLWE